jgi:tetratricopeptide (TPR) repeat protein
MRTIKVNNYKMEKIADRMSKKFEKIRRGEESEYTFTLSNFESNLINIYRRHPEFKSRRVIEAINIFLLKIDAYFSKGIEYDFSRHINDGNAAYLNVLQECCDPLYNKELQENLDSNLDLNDPEDLIELYATPVKCLIRLKESVEMRIKERGTNGYFDFLEGKMSRIVKDDEREIAVTSISEDQDQGDQNNNFLNQIKSEFPEIRPFLETEDFVWEEQAANYFHDGKYNEAETLYKKLCLAQPKHHSGFEGLARIYDKQNKGQKAEWFMKEALKRARAFLKEGSIDMEVIEDMEKYYQSLK